MVDELDSHDLEQMVAGSFANTHHGRPRTTHGLDLVIDGARDGVVRFATAMSVEPYYSSPEAAADAWDRRSMFNVIDTQSGWKVDLIIRKDRTFSIAEFNRRQPADIAEVAVMMSTAEDTIIAKLEWARASASERQIGDIRGILEVQGDRLDLAWIQRWVAALDLGDIWQITRGPLDDLE